MTNNIAAIRKARGLKQADLARMLDVRPASISRYENEDSRLTVPLLRQIAEALDCDVSDLLSPGSGTQAARVNVPEITALLSAGAGAAEQSEGVSTVWQFDKSYVSGIGSNSTGLYIAAALGDSMEPTIRSGERVLVDTNDKAIGRGGIFAFEDSGDLLIKRVEAIPGSKRWKISSDNPAHSAFEVEAGSVSIIGRVVLSLRRL